MDEVDTCSECGILYLESVDCPLCYPRAVEVEEVPEKNKNAFGKDCFFCLFESSVALCKCGFPICQNCVRLREDESFVCDSCVWDLFGGDFKDEEPKKEADEREHKKEVEEAELKAEAEAAKLKEEQLQEEEKKKECECCNVDFSLFRPSFTCGQCVRLVCEDCSDTTIQEHIVTRICTICDMLNQRDAQPSVPTEMVEEDACVYCGESFQFLRSPRDCMKCKLTICDQCCSPVNLDYGCEMDTVQYLCKECVPTAKRRGERKTKSSFRKFEENTLEEENNPQTESEGEKEEEGNEEEGNEGDERVAIRLNAARVGVAANSEVRQRGGRGGRGGRGRGGRGGARVSPFEYNPVDVEGLGPRLKGVFKTWSAPKGFGFISKQDHTAIFVHLSGLKPELAAKQTSLEGMDVSFYSMMKNDKQQAVEVCKWYETPVPRVKMSERDRNKLKEQLIQVKLQEAQNARLRANRERREMMFGKKKPARKKLTPSDKQKRDKTRCGLCARLDAHPEKPSWQYESDSEPDDNWKGVFARRLSQHQITSLARRQRTFDEKVTGRFLFMDANGRELRLRGAANMWVYEAGTAQCDMCGALRPSDRVVGCSRCEYDLCLSCYRDLAKPRPLQPDVKSSSFYQQLHDLPARIQPKEGNSRRGRTCWQEEARRNYTRENKLRGRLA